MPTLYRESHTGDRGDLRAQDGKIHLQFSLREIFQKRMWANCCHPNIILGISGYIQRKRKAQRKGQEDWGYAEVGHGADISERKSGQ